MAAGIAETPEASEHTSIKGRVDQLKAQGRTEELEAAREGSVAGSAASAGLEECNWLCPIEDRRRLGSSREGMLEGFSLGNYVLLVDYTGRLFREGKATISREGAEILERLGTTAETWQARLQKLSRGRLLGRFFAAGRKRLREVAGRLGLKRVPNLGISLTSQCSTSTLGFVPVKQRPAAACGAFRQVGFSVLIRAAESTPIVMLGSQPHPCENLR